MYYYPNFMMIKTYGMIKIMFPRVFDGLWLTMIDCGFDVEMKTSFDHLYRHSQQGTVRVLCGRRSGYLTMQSTVANSTK